ncbi:uncharacterized protein A1O9_02104 [Exophiala aquamarina CBS 119918]|uniref:RING-type domain-containing protein n=1 Tax=Exophiala aquamarina CBS 119918 TaxID=1182545 RepID=A0A072PMH2_9EURO|nr:uncharacterized protein A1O9_02104 [Exophiala aquamarina CBS 119918]KEF60543.1 hypothetical protein A1O9_02104 [Exophiala aquamarina CBS 119918]
METSCYHKPVIGCALVALAGCCACADKRPIAASYPVYIDGQGMRMQGKRWSRYCWKCRDYWDIFSCSSSSPNMNHPSNRVPPADENMATAFDHMTVTTQGQSWSFDGIARADPHQNRPRGLLQSIHAPHIATSSLPAREIRRPSSPDSPSPAQHSLHPIPSAPSRHFTDPPLRGRRPLLQNPFGTLEEIQSENYQSPLEGMFQRAEARYREAEAARQQAEEAHLQAATAEARRIATGEIRQTELIEADINASNHVTVQLMMDIQEAGEAMWRNALMPLENGLEPSHRPLTPMLSPLSDINPIDEQTSRPAPLSREDLTINIACQVCSEQRVDTLLEPCMHIALCRWCSEIIRRGPRHHQSDHGHASRSYRWRCPICRRRVTNARRVYLS